MSDRSKQPGQSAAHSPAQSRGTSTDQRPTLSDEIVAQRIRAQKRAAIGLDPMRPTADRVTYRPGQSRPAPLLRWSAVILAVLLLAAIVLVIALRPDWVDTAGQNLMSLTPAALRETPDTASLAPGEVQLLRHEFDKPVSTMAQHNEPGRWVMGFVDGFYRIRTVQARQIAYTGLGLYNPAPFRAETAVTISSETPQGYAGLINRFQDAQNYYLFQVNGAGEFGVTLLIDGAIRSLADVQPSAAVRPAGGINHLTVIDDGQRIQFVINDELVHQMEEIELPTGDLALAGGSIDDGGSQSDFDWVAVIQIPGSVSGP